MVLLKPIHHPLKEALRREKIPLARAALFIGISRSSLFDLLCGTRLPTPAQDEKLDELTEAINSGKLVVA